MTVGIGDEAAHNDAPDHPLPPLARLCECGIEFLQEVYSDERALFPYSSRRTADGRWLSDYREPAALRYSINTLLGLQAAAASSRGRELAEWVDALIGDFLHLRSSPGSPADRGLLLVLLADLDAQRSVAEHLVSHIDRDFREPRLGTLNMQDLGWMIWGTARAARAGLPGADAASERAFRLMLEHFVDRRTGLPRHSVRRYRRDLVSFGSVVYYLRGLHEYGAASGDREAGDLFRLGVERILELQGPSGEWPWLLDVRRGRIVDPYPIFTVHQDSMAPLFLVPALEEHGIRAARDAVTRSLEWVAGRNELRLPMLVDEPFNAYRSIERREGLGRLRRYLRAAGSSVGSGSREFQSGTVRLNPECRSYHVGWLLYVWAARGDWSGSGAD